MFDPFNFEDDDLTEAIRSAYADLKSFTADDEGYQKTVDQLTKLYALKNQTAQLNFQAQTESATHKRAQAESQWEAEQAELPFYKRVSPDTIVAVAGNLLVAVVVVKYEQTGVIASKVTSFMRKF